MPLKYPSTGGGDFKNLSAGSHLAFCILIADIGLQPRRNYPDDPKHQVYFRFETPNERTEYEKDGRKVEGPMTIGTTYTASMSTKANLRKHLESWRGRPFSAGKVVRNTSWRRTISASAAPSACGSSAPRRVMAAWK